MTDLPQPPADDQCSGPDAAVVVPITDVLDLHQFRPSEIKDLIDDYIEACLAKGIGSVRLIHGKGTGALRERVHRLLAEDPRVAAFNLAPPEAGGWGATLVELNLTQIGAE